MKHVETLEDAAAQMEQALGLPNGFFAGLLKEDDWSFVVKLESLVEAACTHLLVEALGKPELEDIFAQLEIANTRTGKIAFIKALNLLNVQDRGFIHELATLRNTLIHDVKNVALFSFADHIDALSKEQLKKMHLTLFGEANANAQRAQLKRTAKHMFWFRGLAMLGAVYLVKYGVSLQKQRQALILNMAGVALPED